MPATVQEKNILDKKNTKKKIQKQKLYTQRKSTLFHNESDTSVSDATIPYMDESDLCVDST